MWKLTLGYVMVSSNSRLETIISSKTLNPKKFQKAHLLVIKYANTQLCILEL
jgi:hypothetical protein